MRPSGAVAIVTTMVALLVSGCGGQGTTSSPRAEPSPTLAGEQQRAEVHRFAEQSVAVLRELQSRFVRLEVKAVRQNFVPQHKETLDKWEKETLRKLEREPLVVPYRVSLLEGTSIDRIVAGGFSPEAVKIAEDGLRKMQKISAPAAPGGQETKDVTLAYIASFRDFYTVMDDPRTILQLAFRPDLVEARKKRSSAAKRLEEAWDALVSRYGLVRAELGLSGDKAEAAEPTATASSTPGVTIPATSTPIFPAGLDVKMFRVGSEPRALAFDGTHLWVGHSTGVTKLANDGTLLGTFLAGRGVTFGALAFDGKSVWAAYFSSEKTEYGWVRARTVYKLALDGTLLATVGVGDGPRALVFDGQSIWAGHQGAVSKLTQDGMVLGTFKVAMFVDALAFDEKNLWVGGAGDEVGKLTLNGTLLGRFRVGEGHESIVYTGTNIWVSHDRGVSKLNMKGAVQATYKIGDTPGHNPSVLAFDGKSIWVATPGKVSRLSLKGELTLSVQGGRSPSAMVFDGQSIWLADAEAGTVTKLVIP